jgi:transposase
LRLLLCLFAKRLERGRFVWPQADQGVVSLSRAQLSMLNGRHRLAEPDLNGCALAGRIEYLFAKMFAVCSIIVKQA